MQHAGDVPFAVIADPDKRLYAEFDVESAPRALLDPRAWAPILRGVFRSMRATLRGKPVPSLNPYGGRFVLPADFLIASDGRLLACKYGSHVYDQWSVDEILAFSRLRATRALPLAPSAAILSCRHDDLTGLNARFHVTMRRNHIVELENAVYCRIQESLLNVAIDESDGTLDSLRVSRNP